MPNQIQKSQVPMTAEEALEKALYYFGARARVEDYRDDSDYSPELGFGPCLIGITDGAVFKVESYGATFDEAFAKWEKRCLHVISFKAEVCL